jgi:hypothetical protein
MTSHAAKTLTHDTVPDIVTLTFGATMEGNIHTDAQLVRSLTRYEEAVSIVMTPVNHVEPNHGRCSLIN